MILFIMSKERKDDISKKNILQKVVKLVMGLLITTLIALVIWRLYGKIDIKKTDFSKVNIKKQEPTIYDMFKVKSEKKNSSLYYVRIKNIYCDAHKIRPDGPPSFFKIDIVFEAHNKKDAKAIENLTIQTVNEIRNMMKNYPIIDIDRASIMDYVKRDLKSKMNNVLKNDAVVDVYFESFLAG